MPIGNERCAQTIRGQSQEAQTLCTRGAMSSMIPNDSPVRPGDCLCRLDVRVCVGMVGATPVRSADAREARRSVL